MLSRHILSPSRLTLTILTACCQKRHGILFHSVVATTTSSFLRKPVLPQQYQTYSTSSSTTNLSDSAATLLRAVEGLIKASGYTSASASISTSESASLDTTEADASTPQPSVAPELLFLRAELTAVGGGSNLRAALPLYKQAGLAGHLAAQVTLGYHFQMGIPALDVAVDSVKALPWYIQAAHQGDHDAQLLLAMLLETIDQKPMAMDWYETLASVHNYPIAQYVLGFAHHQGVAELGKEKDLDKAYPLLEAAAEQGHLGALYYLVTYGKEGDFWERVEDPANHRWMKILIQDFGYTAGQFRQHALFSASESFDYFMEGVVERAKDRIVALALDTAFALLAEKCPEVKPYCEEFRSQCKPPAGGPKFCAFLNKTKQINY